jgi:hypothetical protein
MSAYSSYFFIHGLRSREWRIKSFEIATCIEPNFLVSFSRARNGLDSLKVGNDT